MPEHYLGGDYDRGPISFSEAAQALRLRLAGDAAAQLLLQHMIDEYSELSTAHSEETANARTDSLTGLPNRRALNDDILWYETRAQQDNGSDRPRIIGHGVAFYDLNGFKKINDTLGHDQGDRVLQVSGVVLRLIHRDVDRVYRTGGDEFITTMRLYDSEDPERPVPPDDDFGVQLQQRFMTTVGDMVDGRHGAILHDNGFGDLTDADLAALSMLGTSVGVVTTMGDVVSFRQMLVRADEKMYTMKRGSR